MVIIIIAIIIQQIKLSSNGVQTFKEVYFFRKEVKTLS